MVSQIELFIQMTQVLDNLVENALKMKEAVGHTFSQDVLENFQNRQHEILHELGQLNGLLEKSPAGGTEDELDECKSQIRDRLAQFQSINQEFFDQINSQTRVIHPKKDAKKGQKK